MPIQVNKISLPEWANGDDLFYNEYVLSIARGAVKQVSPSSFYYRTNARQEITSWLIQDCIHDGVLTNNDAGYLSHVKFETGQGAMEFKLRWC